MARTTPRPAPTETQILQPLQRYCPTCGETLWAAYHNYRTITTLEAVLQHLHPEHVEVEICRAEELAQRHGLTSEGCLVNSIFMLRGVPAPGPWQLCRQEVAVDRWNCRRRSSYSHRQATCVL